MMRFVRFLRNLRLVPLAVIASACLLVLKIADMALGGGYLMSAGKGPGAGYVVSDVSQAGVVRRASEPPRSWAQQMFNFPGARESPPSPSSAALPRIAGRAAGDMRDGDITGTVPSEGAEKSAAPKEEVHSSGHGGGAKKEAEKKDDEKKEGKKEGAEKGEAASNKVPLTPEEEAALKIVKAAKEMRDSKDVKLAIPPDGSPAASGAERAILERLQERRQELEARGRELDIREGLIAAAEKRVDDKLTELKQVESEIAAATQKKDEAQSGRLKGLVSMYENMKPRDAAKIFDRLDITVLLEVAGRINPRRMADILALMSPDAAEHLTVELASRAQATTKSSANDLPKIDGHPTTP